MQHLETERLPEARAQKHPDGNVFSASSSFVSPRCSPSDSGLPLKRSNINLIKFCKGEKWKRDRCCDEWQKHSSPVPVKFTINYSHKTSTKCCI